MGGVIRYAAQTLPRIFWGNLFKFLGKIFVDLLKILCAMFFQVYAPILYLDVVNCVLPRECEYLKIFCNFMQNIFCV